ncbi:hypothetical protein L2E82_36085 [Cichorium intybus]|uniref:Uncharacterized protein n=1 Tax=Cichorium intybus TaxID=13427 RepID=A0ACB9BQW0_CICIN|nr:hypothetical protein L2E82_36085 [Cichorium intybus]
MLPSTIRPKSHRLVQPDNAQRIQPSFAFKRLQETNHSYSLHLHQTHFIIVQTLQNIDMGDLDLNPYMLTDRAGEHDDSNGTTPLVIPPRNRRIVEQTKYFFPSGPIRRDDKEAHRRAVESIANGCRENMAWLWFLAQESQEEVDGEAAQGWWAATGCARVKGGGRREGGGCSELKGGDTVAVRRMQKMCEAVRTFVGSVGLTTDVDANTPL